MLRIVLLAVVGFLALGGMAAWALPGPQQAFFPGHNGLTEFAPGLFTDDPARGAELLARLDTAEATEARFWGTLPERPRIVFCTNAACAERLGIGKRGAVTYGSALINVSPKGLSSMHLAHELSHIALHSRMGVGDLVRPRFPAWFDEGLASWTSGDTRLVAPDAEARARILATRQFRQWGGAVSELGWRRAYGAGQALVAEMAAAQGPAALRALIDRVAAGADFDTERAALLDETMS